MSDEMKMHGYNAAPGTVSNEGIVTHVTAKDFDKLRTELEAARGIIRRLVEWDKLNNRSSVEALVARDAIVADARAFLEKG